MRFSANERATDEVAGAGPQPLPSYPPPPTTFSRPDDNMRTALDALAAEHGVGVRLPRAASRSGLSMWLVSRRVDALSHSFKLANVHNNMHLFLYTLICNQPAA